jgi:hypothetical protein
MQFFEELPLKKSGGVKVDWASVKADLIEGAGKWGLMVENTSSSTIDQLRNGRYKDFRGEELKNFEFATRKPDNPDTPYAPRRTDLYGRYNA